MSIILLLDADSAERQIVGDFLRDQGCEVLEGSDGKEGLSKLKAYSPSLIITSMSLLSMTGIELLAEVRRINETVPVIVTSKAPCVTDVVEALNLGACNFIVRSNSVVDDYSTPVAKALEVVRLRCKQEQYVENLVEGNIKLENSLNLMNADQEAGRCVQMKLLPETPFYFHHYELSHKIIPSLCLSGDFIDYFAINDDEFGFYLADVSGHGSSSAFVTVLLKAVMGELRRALPLVSAHNTELRSPARVLGRINDELVAASLGKHVAMFYGVINRHKGMLTYSVAAYYPFPILAGEGCAKFIGSPALPLGVFEEIDVVEYREKLSSNFSLVMFSDGVMDILPEGTLAEKEAFLLDLIKRGKRDLNDIAGILGLDALKSVSDDIGVLVIKGP